MEWRMPREIMPKNAGEIERVNPDDIAALDDEQSSGDEGPSSERFEGFVTGVDIDQVSTEQGDDVPIDASMDELFAEQ